MSSSSSDESVPPWDVALEGLMKETFRQTGTPLRIADFGRLARDHTIRFDDLMATAFELVFHHRWRYEDPSGTAHLLTRQMVQRLYVNGRLREEDAQELQGQWSPVAREG